MQAKEIALDAALLVMRNGGSTVAADRSFGNFLKGYNLEGVATVWRLDFIATTNAAESQSSTVVRAVGPVGANLLRASEVAALGERVSKGEVALTDLEAKVEETALHPWCMPRPRWTASSIK